MTDAQKKRLFQFFAAYFHQDWGLEADDADGVITRFIDDQADKRQLAGLAALGETYSAAYDESALGERLHRELGCEYLPTADGMTFHEWLAHVARRLRAAAGGPGAT